MQVIQGKQAVLRSYLTEEQCAAPAILRPCLSEEQCVKPVQGQLAVPESPVNATMAPVNYVTKSTSVKEAAVSKPQKHFARVAEAQTLTVSEQSVERAVVKELPTVPLRSAAVAVETGHIMDVTEEDDLTIEQLFARR